MLFQTRTTERKLSCHLITEWDPYQGRGFVNFRRDVSSRYNGLSVRNAEIHETWLEVHVSEQGHTSRSEDTDLCNVVLFQQSVNVCDSVQHCLLEYSRGEAPGLGVWQLDRHEI